LDNVVVAIGQNIVENSFDRWLKEKQKLTAKANVRYIHTKYMLVDPLGENPIIVTGSANFSKASTTENDENMVVIQGDKRVADIYLGEFMRLFTHYSFREAAMKARKNETTWQPKDLCPNDSWQAEYFQPGKSRFLRRKYFSGS
jgi:phosphatidylserine/phosphatidylglycerophosphate/cardiolipin synthase-like enzyme